MKTTEDAMHELEDALRTIWDSVQEPTGNIIRYLLDRRAEAAWDEAIEAAQDQGTIQTPDNPYRSEQ